MAYLDKFCNLKCLVYHKLYRRKKSQCNIIYFTAHSSNIPKIMKLENYINNFTYISNITDKIVALICISLINYNLYVLIVDWCILETENCPLL